MPFIQATWEITDPDQLGGLWFEASQGKMLARSHSPKKLGVVLHAFHLSYNKDVSKRITFLPSPGKECETLPEKINKTKRADGVVPA
jgi:hypothetical protein